jgi:lipid II isoglutaminyl synthase (glutamine-hydrolysing)
VPKLKLTLAHLYPDQMNLYGDFGNIQTLERRSVWRGIDFEIMRVGVGEPLDWSAIDLFFLGGGQDRGQSLIADDLQARKREIAPAVADGLGGLLVCGGYQLFGRYFQTSSDERIDGLGILPAHTIAGPKRLIGNLVGELTLPLEPKTLVGFENHSGETFLDPSATPLARVIKGYGNNRDSGSEGLIHYNLFGTYCHGSLLPKNPHLADELLRRALERRYGSAKLEPLDDTIELAAHHAAIRRAKTAETLSI